MRTKYLEYDAASSPTLKGSGVYVLGLNIPIKCERKICEIAITIKISETKSTEKCCYWYVCLHIYS